MSGLLDIAPAEIVTKSFDIRGGTLTIRGIKNKEWLALLARFPDIKKLIDGTGMNMVDVFESAVEGLIPAIVAAGLGNCGDEATEELVRDRLNEAEQFAIFEAIMEIGAVEKEAARRKVNPLPKSPETEPGNLLNGSTNPDQTTNPSSQPASL